jgi:hypothetical protein
MTTRNGADWVKLQATEIAHRVENTLAGGWWTFTSQTLLLYRQPPRDRWRDGVPGLFAHQSTPRLDGGILTLGSPKHWVLYRTPVLIDNHHKDEDILLKTIAMIAPYMQNKIAFWQKSGSIVHHVDFHPVLPSCIIGFKKVGDTCAKTGAGTFAQAWHGCCLARSCPPLHARYWGRRKRLKPSTRWYASTHG